MKTGGKDKTATSGGGEATGEWQWLKEKDVKEEKKKIKGKEWDAFSIPNIKWSMETVLIVHECSLSLIISKMVQFIPTQLTLWTL